MAIPSYKLVSALKETIGRLEEKNTIYNWTHQGSCNCGHLAQTITKLSKSEIHKLAIQKAGDWEEKTIDYCKNSGYPIDHIIDSMIELGLSTSDIANLERLSCSKILKNIPKENKPLNYKNKEDVILYMKIWTNILEEQLNSKRNTISKIREKILVKNI